MKSSTKPGRDWRGMWKEKKKYDEKDGLIAGIDEVGRGCLAGPMLLAITVFQGPRPNQLEKVTDSKKMTEEARERAFPLILEHALAIGLGWVTHQEIDKFNINGAWRLAAIRAVDEVTPIVNGFSLFVDGTDLVPDFPEDRQQAIPKADFKVWQVSAASVVAKVIRDREMKYFHEFFPAYGWDSNKGYGTPAHREALKAVGPSPLHRWSFIRKLLD